MDSGLGGYDFRKIKAMIHGSGCVDASVKAIIYTVYTV
jgi:hypothetical protein